MRSAKVKSSACPTRWMDRSQRRSTRRKRTSGGRSSILSRRRRSGSWFLPGRRLREILNARWEHVDFERGILFLPDSKTGRKPVYLSAATLAILAGLPRIEGNPFVIAGMKDGAPRADLKKPWAAVTKAANLEGLRIHDLRHSFASIGAGASLGLPIIGKLLGHTQAATTQRYAHLGADPVRRAAETIGATIAAAMDNHAANVTPMVKSR
jgi:integrase